MPHRIKQILTWSGVSFGAFLLLIAATLFTVANTHLPLNHIAGWLGGALSNDDLQVRIVGMEGRLGSSITIGNVTVADKTGVFAEARDISLVWSPWSLRNNLLHVLSLSAAQLKLNRLPSTGPQGESGDLDLPAFGFRAETINVSEIRLEPSLMGPSRGFALKGAVEFDPSLARAALNLETDAIGSKGDSASVNLVYAAQPARFVADVSIDEPSGGLIAFLAGLPPGERLSVSLKGTGPTDRWQGLLKFESGAAAAVNADVTVALKDETLNVGLNGTANILSFIPASLHPLLGSTLAFRGDAALQRLEQLKVHRFAANGGTVTLKGHGGYGLANGSLKAEIAIALTESENIVLPGVRIAESHLQANIDGSLEAPNVNLSFRSDSLAYDSVQVRKATGLFQVRTSQTGAYLLEGSLRSEGFDPGLPLANDLLGRSLDIKLSGTLNKLITGSDLTLIAQSGQVQAEIASLFSSRDRANTRAVVRIGTIAPLSRDVGLALDGKAQVEATLVSDHTAGTISATVSGAFTELARNNPALGSILGNRVPFSGAAAWQPGSPIEIIGLEVSTATGRLAADGKVDLDSERLAANIDLALPALGPFSQFIAAKMDGSANASALLTGSFDSISAQGQARIEDVRIGDTALGNLGVGYSTRIAPGNIAASFRLGGDLQGQPLGGSFDAVLRDQRVALSDIEITVGENNVVGFAGLVPAKNQVDGKLLITLDNIAGIPGAALSGLGGRAELQITSDHQQHLTIKAKAETLRIGKESEAIVIVGDASAALQIRSPLSQPGISGQLTGTNIAVAGLREGAVTLELDGSLSRIAWHARADAQGPRPGTIAASGELTRAGDQLGLSVFQLNGDVMGFKMALASPFEVTSEPPAWRISPVDIQFGSGRIRFSGNLGAGDVDVAFAIENLPIRHAALFDPRFQLEGVLDARLKMSGRAEKPHIVGSISAKEVRPRDLEKIEFAGFSADLSLLQSAEETKFELSLAGPTTTTRMDAKLSTSPLVKFGTNAEVDFSTYPLRGELKASGRLDLIDRIIGLGEDRLDGSVETAAVITGTVGDPIINGDLRLADGAYEGAAVGTLLRNITGHIAFTGKAARIVSLKMDDGDTGRLTGSGSLDFANVENPSGGIELTFENFTALRHQLAEMTTSGSLALTGSFRTPRLAGKLRVDKGEIRIPDALPENVVVLDVEEVNLGNAASQKTISPAEPAASATLAVALGIDIEIPGQTFVRGRGLDSEWKGALSISGTSRAPAIAGKLQAVRGTFAFAGKTFFIKNGEVFFPGGKVAEPEIDAVAEAKLREIVARVSILGTVSKPSIGVSSEPSLPQEDVLSQILFGQTAGQLSPLQAAQLAQTAATLSGAGGTGIIDKVRQALGVDVLNVDSGEGDGRGASLKAGKYITEDVFLSVTQGTTPGSQKVGVEVQVLPNITVESNVSGEADSNIGVNWKWDY